MYSRQLTVFAQHLLIMFFSLYLMDNIFDLNSDNFDEYIKKGNVIVDFAASWCNPCVIMEPHLKEASKELRGRVKFGKVDVDSENELAMRFQVMSIPTTIFFKNGEQVNRHTGAMSKDLIIEKSEASF